MRNREERLKPGRKEIKALVSKEPRTLLQDNLGWAFPKLLSLSISVPFLVAAWNSKTTNPSSDENSHFHFIHENRNFPNVSHHSASEAGWYFHIILCLKYYNHFWSLCRTSYCYSFWYFQIPDYICKPMKSRSSAIMVRPSLSGFLGLQLLLR